MDAELQMFILEEVQKISKVHLHVHMETTQRLNSLYADAHVQHNLFGEYKGVPQKHRELHNLEIFSRLLKDLLIREALDNVRYLEFRLNLLRWINSEADVERFFSVLDETLHYCEVHYRIIGRAILLIRRDYDVNHVSKLIKHAISLSSKNLVGIDLAGHEKKFPYDAKFTTLFRYAKENGLNITVHAGEFGPPENIIYAVEILGASRIAHGISSIKDQQVLSILADKQILLEISLSSNIFTRLVTDYHMHPIKELLKNEIPLCLNADLPVKINTSLSEEYLHGIEDCKLDIATIKKMNSNAFDFRFDKTVV